jgi:hypothetical protein
LYLLYVNYVLTYVPTTTPKTKKKTHPSTQHSQFSLSPPPPPPPVINIYWYVEIWNPQTVFPCRLQLRTSNWIVIIIVVVVGVMYIGNIYVNWVGWGGQGGVIPNMFQTLFFFFFKLMKIQNWWYHTKNESKNIFVSFFILAT